MTRCDCAVHRVDAIDSMPTYCYLRFLAINADGIPIIHAKLDRIIICPAQGFDIGQHIAKVVDAIYLALHQCGAYCDFGYRQAYQCFNWRTELLQWYAACQMRGGRTENIAPMKGVARRSRQPILRVV